MTKLNMTFWNIRKFEFITPDHLKDPQFNNWSRMYEWGYVLHELSKLQTPIRIHNTCVGPGLIHKQFHDALVGTNHTIVNSDVQLTDINRSFDNMHYYNIATKWNRSREFDVVLCISTFEELPSVNKRFKGSPEERMNNLKSLLSNFTDQVKHGGRLILTLDYPDIDYVIWEKLFGVKIKHLEHRLVSPHKMSSAGEEAYLSVILIDLDIFHHQ
jgi:hypothetical protein